jgi:hypothetical protein
MLIYLLAFVVGVLTIPSPRILRVLPFVFGRADQPFRRSRLPLMVGMALTFSAVAIAAAFGGARKAREMQHKTCASSLQIRFPLFQLFLAACRFWSSPGNSRITQHPQLGSSRRLFGSDPRIECYGNPWEPQRPLRRSQWSASIPPNRREILNSERLPQTRQ